MNLPIHDINKKVLEMAFVYEEKVSILLLKYNQELLRNSLIK